jgi:hypothetical protein
MSSESIKVLQAGNISVTGNHVVLEDLARDLVRSLDGCPEISKPVIIHVGAHRSRRLIDQTKAIQIGIQTEQMCDTSGRPLWKLFSRQRLSRMIKEFDVILDLSFDNAPAYDSLPDTGVSKLRFGPNIFPLRPPATRPPGKGLLFVGAMNERRRDSLRLLGTRAVQVPPGTFGRDLDRAIEQAEGLLNLHYFEGVYTEYPRILKAVLSGRALWSEPLASPMREGTHYFAPTSQPSLQEVIAAQSSMSQLLCGHYSLWSFIQQELRN